MNLLLLLTKSTALKPEVSLGKNPPGFWTTCPHQSLGGMYCAISTGLPFTYVYTYFSKCVHRLFIFIYFFYRLEPDAT